MAITVEDAAKFKELYKKETGKDISDEEAMKSITSLVNLLRIIYRPIKKSDFEKYKNKHDKLNKSDAVA